MQAQAQPATRWSHERQLCDFFFEHPIRSRLRYSTQSERELLESLFWSMAGGKSEHMRLLFPDGKPRQKLRDAQGAVEGSEYTEAARGKTCGHIFRPGEASYHCKTCSTDDTCCLCSRCFEATDHQGHMIRINVSSGGGSCCDCGDVEAWTRPMLCAIHSETTDSTGIKDKTKEPGAGLPQDLVTNMRMTIGRVFDYICDVISCSPEQLRRTKTRASVEGDEAQSRLSSSSYSHDCGPCDEFALIVWNDEKHTLDEVRDQVARACQVSSAKGLERALETDSLGRSILKFGTDIDELLGMAKTLEDIKVTTTIRSSRDTFREQMCGTMVEWLNDVSGCSVGDDHKILRNLVCEEMLKAWRQGSQATHAIVGKEGLFDEAKLCHELDQKRRRGLMGGLRGNFTLEAVEDSEDDGDDIIIIETGSQNGSSDDEGDDDDDDHDDGEDEDTGNQGADHMDNDEARDNGGPSISVPGLNDDDDDVIMVDAGGGTEANTERRAADQAAAAAITAMPATAAAVTDDDDDDDDDEDTGMVGYPPPPPPTAPTFAGGARVGTAAAAAARRAALRDRDLTPSDSDTAEPLIAPSTSMYSKPNIDVPKTESNREIPPPRPGSHWLETPAGYLPQNQEQAPMPLEEDVFRRVRLDWLMLFDLRMWKKVRNDLKSLYITTVIQVPEFKRVLSLRFAALYTALSQLYLIGDREPDHSIVNISLQMLTTPSITAEIVERGNFLATLLAILYTYLTTRQVGYPYEVSSDAVLSLDANTAANRRMYHFYADLQYLLGSPHVQEKIRSEERYLVQFLDLVKLHQGISPNVRAMSRHVEYENEGWITAQLVTRKFNIKAKQLAEAFRGCQGGEEEAQLRRAIRMTAKTVILNSIGADRERFKHAEIKDTVKFRKVHDFEFDEGDGPGEYRVVRFVVEQGHVSFHHGLHYTLSWLVERGRHLDATILKDTMSFTAQELRRKPRCMGRPLLFPAQELTAEDYLLAALDFPLRVCAWMAQIKAGMWVRNGISLRHQATTYRGVAHRELSYQRDIFLLQTAMVVCDPRRMLASILDRYGMVSWVKGFYEQKSEAQDDVQHLEVAEEMVHLLIVILSDRIPLVPSLTGSEDAVRRDIAHVLCLKPLSFQDMCNKLPEHSNEQEAFHRVLKEMTTFKSPEGLTDVGTFELLPKFLSLVDPYNQCYSKNHREEAEMAWRKHMAEKTGRAVEDVVYEPKLPPITSGAYKDLAAFTSTGMFAQIIYYSLLYPLVASRLTPLVPFMRVEAFLHVVLHLVLVAIAEDKSGDNAPDASSSFVSIALTRVARSNFMSDAPLARTIVSLLELMAGKDEFKSCHAKVFLILKRMRQKQPRSFEAAYLRLGLAPDRVATASPAIAGNSAEEVRERKKKAALSRQAKVLEQFQQQQKSFLERQGSGMDWDLGDVDDDDELVQGDVDRGSSSVWWKYPTGTCILCQEATDERRLYGTFAHFTESHILRQTDLQDPDFVLEAFETPTNLDRPADDLRPFGVAGNNKRSTVRHNARGDRIKVETQKIAKGFPARLCRAGTVSTGCGHMMHYSCFETYYDAINRRHLHQIARHQPENLGRLEFVCPLCKALGNAFLPVIWKGRQETYPGPLYASSGFPEFVETQMTSESHYLRGVARQSDAKLLSSYMKSTFIFSRQQSPSTSTLTPTPAPAPAPPRPATIAITAAGPPEWQAPSTVGPPTAPSGFLTAAASAAPSEPSASAGSGARSPLPFDPVQRLGDLIQAYTRLRETLRTNSLLGDTNTAKLGPGNRGPGELSGGDVLARTVGYTISAVEIQQRGVGALYERTLVSKLPEQLSTHLRILSETATSYTSFGGVGSRPNGVPIEPRRLDRDSERQHCQLFAPQYLGRETDHARRPADAYPPLLSLDPFLFLCEASFGMARDLNIDIAHLVRLCYLAEIVKLVFHMGRNIPVQIWTDRLVSHDGARDDALVNFAEFAFCITSRGMEISGMHHESLNEPGPNQGFAQEGLDTLEGYYSFVRRYALVFLRKCAIFMYVSYGVSLDTHVSPDPSADELDRLTEALRVPGLDEMCSALTEHGPTYGWPLVTKTLVKGWIEHHAMWHQTWGEGALPRSALVSHPAIFELLGLPDRYALLIEEAAQRKCPANPSKDLSDPVLCLFCGEMVCYQSKCCTTDEPSRPGEEPVKIGGSQRHMRRCQGNVGLFLNIRRCTVLYLYHKSGSFNDVPYTDQYGETELAFRNGRELFLHRKRYDLRLRNVVLGHGIPTFIGRKLEADFNNGGWETL